MFCKDDECLGACVVNGTLRFLGSITRNVCEGFYFFIPFLRPEEKTEDSARRPIKPAAPFVSTLRVEVPPPIKFEALHKPSPEIKKASPIDAFFEAIKPAVREKVEEKPAEPIEKRSESKPVEADAFFKGIAFHDPGEAMRAEIYVKDFNAGSPKMRRDALGQIEQLPRPLAVEILKRVMKGQKDVLVQMELLDALSGLNQDGSLDKQFFREHLKSDNSILRLAAVRAFSKYKDEDSFEILVSATHDSDPEIRKRAMNSLLTSFEKRSVPYVMRALNDSDAQVRKSAVSICGILRAKPAISALISLLGDPERDVQKAANEALKKITGEDFDFIASSSQATKKGAIEAWRYWWRDHQSGFGASSSRPKAAVATVAAMPVKGKLSLGQL